MPPRNPSRPPPGTTYGVTYTPREVPIDGLLVVDYEVLSKRDARGCATEPLNLSQWDLAGLPGDFMPFHTGWMEAVPGSLRGAHAGPAKMVNVATPGIRILAMELDCRPGSPTFGHVWSGWIDWTTGIYVPAGVANAMYVDPANKWPGIYQLQFPEMWLWQKDRIRVTLADPLFGIDKNIGLGPDLGLDPRMLAAARESGLWLPRDDPEHDSYEYLFQDLPAELLAEFAYKG